MDYFDQSLIGNTRENETYLCKVTGVKPGGTPAINGTWSRLPDEGTSGVQKEVSEWTVENVAGKTSAKKTQLKGVNYDSTLNQRNAEVLTLDEDFADSDCLLLVKSHNFDGLASPKQQWILVFGSVNITTDAIDLQEGRAKFKFSGRDNAVEIVVGGAGIALPSGITNPPTTITIAKGGVWKPVDVAHTP